MAEDIVNIIKASTLDLKIYDNKRLLRLSNSMHPKTNLYKIQITNKELNAISFKELEELAKEPRIEEKRIYKFNIKAHAEYMNNVKKFNLILNRPKINKDMKSLDYTPPCIEYLLNNPTSKGQRNSTLALLASYYNQSGCSSEEAIEALSIWNNNIVSPCIKEEELINTINSIYQGDHKMGCSTASIMSQCDKEKCKFSKRGK